MKKANGKKPGRSYDELDAIFEAALRRARKGDQSAKHALYATGFEMGLTDAEIERELNRTPVPSRAPKKTATATATAKPKKRGPSGGIAGHVGWAAGKLAGKVYRGVKRMAKKNGKSGKAKKRTGAKRGHAPVKVKNTTIIKKARRVTVINGKKRRNSERTAAYSALRKLKTQVLRAKREGRELSPEFEKKWRAAIDRWWYALQAEKEVVKKNPLEDFVLAPIGASIGASIVKAASGSKKKTSKKKTARRGTKLKRRNLDHPDSQHQIKVSKHWRAGGASQWQRAAAAGQHDLFEHGIRKRGNGKGLTKRQAINRNSKKRRNSEASATELYRMFQGREPNKITSVKGDSSMPSHVSELGWLSELVLEDGRKISLRAADGVKLAGAKVNGKDRLFIVGNYEAERPAGVHGPIQVDRVRYVTYVTHKDHIGDGKTYFFEHEHGEEGGSRPMLTIDGESGKLHLVGGSYYITESGIRD